MKIIDIIHRTTNPIPWSEGEKIPWNESGFSVRMLREHLSQEHDPASRRSEIIDRHVSWIHGNIMKSKPGKILDLGCGPGLYTSRLARLGHICTGIDFSPASIAYARENALLDGLNCTYMQSDLRTAEFGHDYDLVMLIFGELNTFRPSEARAILGKATKSLVFGGRLILEVHSFELVRKVGESPPSWYSSTSGLFSDSPHLCLTENTWDPVSTTATTRHYIIHDQPATVCRYAQSLQAYSTKEYRSILKDCGFRNLVTDPSPSGSEDNHKDGLVWLIAERSHGN